LQEQLPKRIDRSYWVGMFSNITGARLMDAMQFLNMIDANAKPTPRLKLLVSGTTGEHRAALLRQVGDEAYAFIFKGNLDTQNATYAALEDVFQNAYPMKSDICRKCIKFFLEFSEDAGIPLSPQLTQKSQNPPTNPETKSTTYKWIGKDRLHNDYGNNSSDNRLQQVTFLHALAQDFEHFDQTYHEAVKILCKHEKTPTAMWEEEWLRVIGALEEYYKSVKFLYKIAQLTELGIIDMDLLYIFYHDEITENLTFKLKRLIQWCGTGLDLASDYNPFELARIIDSLVNLYEKLNNIHQERGNDILLDADMLKFFKEQVKDFLANLGEFHADSPHFFDKYVDVMDKETINNDEEISIELQPLEITPEIQNVLNRWKEFAKANDIEFDSSGGYWAKKCFERNGACICDPIGRPVCPCEECLSEIKRDGHCFCRIFESHEFADESG
jgi:hypothetical protein